MFNSRIHPLYREIETGKKIFAKQNQSSKNQAKRQESKKHARNAEKLQKNMHFQELWKDKEKQTEKTSPKDERKTRKNKNKNIQIKFGPLF